MINFTDITYFNPLEPGVTKMGINGSQKGDGFAFAFDVGAYFGVAKDFGVLLYDKELTVQKIPFSKDVHTGSIYGLAINNKALTGYTYNFYLDDEIIIDPYAHNYAGNHNFGDESEVIRASLISDKYNWDNDLKPHIPYEDSILYGLNVRAFTKNSNSKVKHKGTFEGIVEKIPYLKELGITSIVLMPAYEYDECEEIKKEKSISLSLSLAKVNCWGFQNGYYFAPKASYAASKNPSKSFKDMVKALHSNGLEVIMQFYFPASVSQLTMLNALKYWAFEYHVDGFRLEGFHIPYRMLISEPTLRDTKLWFNYIPDEDSKDMPKNPNIRNIASTNGAFRYDMRRILKGDEGMTSSLISNQRLNSSSMGIINLIADYDGFSLNDIFSYERKHNETNGEDNRDGTDYNLSWNCGIEGETRKKNILELRKKQIKNALALLLLSEGTPYIFSGDEFGNTRFGNNNAYCQDNDTGYIKWKMNSYSEEILAFTKKLIVFRKNAGIPHSKDALTNYDIHGDGYPDISYHGKEAYIPDLNHSSRTLGLFFFKVANENVESYYLGVNMHWEEQYLAFPKLKNYLYISDIKSTNSSVNPDEIKISEGMINISPRSILLITICKKDDTNVKAVKSSKNHK